MSNLRLSEHGEFRIPDYTLLRCIGSGSSGKVWLAKNQVTGAYHAVKVVHRADFTDEKPYLRELRGIRKFEPISRSHPGFVNILHVGQDETEGRFYYVMELADDVAPPTDFAAERYKAKTAENRIREGCQFAVDQVLELGLRLSDALHFLHEQGLVHRDIKPSNLLFVSGRPKLADIGLVTDAEDANSMVGTPGYVPPEGPGSRQADVFALGKVLYECLTGLDRTEFPTLPSFFDGHPDHQKFLELNEIVLKACHQDLRQRYQTARQLHADLTAVENGESVVRLRQLEFKLSRFKRLARIGVMALIFAGLAGLFVQREFRARDQDRQRMIGALIGRTGRAVEDGDYATALRDTAGVLNLLQSDKMTQINRFRYGTILGHMPKLTLLQALDTAVTGCRFVANDSTILVALGDGRCQIRNPSMGTVTGELLGHTDKVNAAIISSDNATFATASEDGTARLWESSSARQLRQLEHPRAVTAADFSRDGKVLATGCADGFVRFWNRDSGALVREFKAHSKPVTSLSFSHSGNLLASSGRDGTARLWRYDTAQAVGEPLKHVNWVMSVNFSPDDQRLVTACSDHSAYVWSVTSSSLVLPPLKHERGVRRAEFSPDGSAIATAAWDDFVCLWDSVTGELQPPMLRHSSPLICAAFSASGHQLVTGCTDGTLRIWNLAGRRSARRLHAHNLNSDGSLFLRLHERAVELYATAQPEKLWKRIETDTTVKQAFLNDKGSLVATIGASPRRDFRIWGVDDGKARSPIISLTNSAIRVVFDKTDARIAIIENNALTIRTISSGEQVSQPIVKNERIESVSFSSDGKKMALVSSDQVDVRDAKTGQLLFPPLTHQFKVSTALVSPDSKQVVTCTSDITVGTFCYAQVWDANTGHPIGGKLWHRDGVLGAAWALNERQLITISEDGWGRIWSLPSGEVAGKDIRHGDQISYISLRSEPEMAITASMDQTARIWDVEGGEPVSPPYPFPGSLTRTWFCPGSTKFIVQEATSEVWVQEIDPAQEAQPVLQGLADVLAGHSALYGHADELAGARTLAAQWKELRSHHPGKFSVSKEDHYAWLRFQAERFQAAKQHRFEHFYVNEILRLFPSDPSALRRKKPLEEALAVDAKATR